MALGLSPWRYAFARIRAGLPFLALALVLGLLLVAAPVRAAEITPPADDGLPIRVTPSVTIDQIGDISDKAGVFEAEIGLSVSWKDRRLAFDAFAFGKEQEDFLNEAALAKLATIWHPKVAILNLIEVPRNPVTTLAIRPDGTVRLMRRLAIKARTPWELNDFPFDRQTLVLQIGSTELGREVVALRNGTVSLARNLLIKNWNIERTDQNLVEQPGISGGIIAGLHVGIRIARASHVAVTQIFLPYLAIMFMPLIVLFNVGPNTPAQLFTALLALLTLNFKIVLEQPAIVAVTNAVSDTMWMGYFYIGISLLLALTAMRVPSPDKPVSDVGMELRNFIKWASPLIFVSLVTGRIFAAM